ncbi:surface lipoprotein assembly modifier [Yoonia sediminilitoris]|uniref:Uncharacterized protein DUF560 n=1 Tax=Yoonia sediminilitoris TaxID=1286148 RepID=A0A2T6KJU3_9RHOB|nr:surface lipoprotein assembly modifier [Yoonia sediminilitoris]PUB16240.1 uncharacterized protein DUF560 [Yoonia sediminilitoris]RCW96589.1 uncharacterized protein DUF560 [Yoonia sediminilitoris]
MNKAILLAACLFGQAAIAQTTVDIPIDEASVIARRALFAGETELALQIARGLLQVNPDDREALLLVAAGAPRVGQATQGRIAGARAYRLAQNDIQAYEAARLTALAAANEERFTLSTFWLRRALIYVPNDSERERTLADARTVRRANPWSTSIGFSVAPSNNVNGGVDDADGGTVGVLTQTFSADAVAQPGVRASLNFGTSYRFHESPVDRASVSLQYQAARVKLRDEVVENPFYEAAIQSGRSTEGIAETVQLDAAQFGLDYLSVGVSYDRALEIGTVGVRYDTGLLEFGEERIYDFNRATLSFSRALTEDTTLQLVGRREIQEHENENTGQVRRTTLIAGLSYRLGNGDRISTSYTKLDSESESINYTYDEWSWEVGYGWAEPIGPVSVSVSAGIKRADYPSYFLSFADGRQDEGYFYGIELDFPEFEYAGFSPGISIQGTDTESNVSRFTRNSISTQLTINSAF